MQRKLARAIFPLVVLAIIAALTIGASSKCCIGNLCLFGGGDDGDDTGNPVSWSTDVVSLECDDFYIVANGQTFYADVAQVDVNSDPGYAGYCTLELIWQENGVEMRLNMYFKADGQKWWSDEVRTYDGQTNADWIYYTGTFFESDLGEAFTGSIDIPGALSPSRVHFGGLTLEAFLSAGEPETVTGLALNKWETTMVVGSDEQLVATVWPPNAADPSVVWTSTDDSIASVSDSGLVSAVTTGAATITVTTVDQGLTATCTVTVVDWQELIIKDATDNLSSVFSEGSEVRFAITVRNPTDGPLSFNCHDTQVYDIQGYNTDNVLVWNWAHDKVFAQVVSGLVLDPGEEKTFEETWDQKDNDGNQVPTGTYAVYHEFVCQGLGVPAPHEFGPQLIEIA